MRALLLTLLLGAAPVHAEVLRIGADLDYPPYILTEADGAIAGFDKDLMDLICARGGYECEWVQMDIGDTFTAVARGDVDVAIGGIGVTAARREIIDYTCVYDIADGGSGTFFGMVSDADIPSATIAVTAATVHEAALLNEGFDAVPYETNEAALQAMLNGQTDLYFGTPTYVRSALGNLANTLFTFGDLRTETAGAAIVIAQNSYVLQADLNSILAELSSAGTIGQLQQRWFGYNQGDMIAQCQNTPLQS